MWISNAVRQALGLSEEDDGVQACDGTPALEVTVAQSDTNEKIEGARVSVRFHGETLTADTDADGKAWFDLPRAGRCDIDVAFPNDDAVRPRYQVPATHHNIRVRNVDRPKRRRVRVDPVRRLEIIDADHHFAPGAENLQLNYRINGHSGDAVIIRVTSPHYPNNPIYEYRLADGEKADGDPRQLLWDGQTTCRAGPLQGRHINPLYGPYEARLHVGRTQSNAVEFWVLYHSIDIVDGTYTPDGEPDQMTDPVAWVQYKLNELGYYAGPVTGAVNAQTRRAIRRYTYARPHEYGAAPPRAREIEDETDADLLAQLGNDEGERERLSLEHFPRDGETARGYIDNDYFYETDGEFLDPGGHIAKSNAKLDRFEYPLEVEIRLVSRADAGWVADRGVEAPEGVGPAEIRWGVVDPPNDDAQIPAVALPHIPSYGRNYIQQAMNSTALAAGDAVDPQDNCPNTNGGSRNPAVGSSANFFATGNSHEPFTTVNRFNRAVTTAHDDPTVAADKLGRAGALFLGSKIAGDNYVLEAHLIFDSLPAPRRAALEQEHTNLLPGGGALTDITTQKTGTLTQWHRHHIAAVVNWPNPGRAINYDEIRAAYAAAHCEVAAGDPSTYAIQDLLDTPAKRDEWLAIVNNAHGWPLAGLTFNNNGLYPRALPAQGGAESSANYKIRLAGVITAFDNNDMLDEMAQLIAREVANRDGAGSIILRPNWHAPARLRSEIPLVGRIVDVLQDYVYTFWQANTADSCIGLCSGVAFLDNAMTIDEQDGFLYAHEMGHCRFLQHWEAPGGQAGDHDTHDHNCMMSYPEDITSRNPPHTATGLTWNKGDPTEPRFCGKCILKLRGWNVRVGLPAHH